MNRNPNSKVILTLLVIAGILVVALVMLGNWYWLYPQAERGSIGEMFGVASAAFSGLAFALLILTLWLQNRELRLQRLELEHTREELKGQREQLEAQAETMGMQQFENTYFQLLRLHTDRADRMDMGQNTEGHECFRAMFNGFFRKRFAQIVPSGDSDWKDKIDAAFSSTGDFIDNMLFPYFRELFRIIEFADKSAPKDTLFYTNLLADTMTVYEKLLLFYYALSMHSPPDLKKYIERFSLVKGIVKEQLALPEHKELYDPQAYGFLRGGRVE